jgi:hypothetical protein
LDSRAASTACSSASRARSRASRARLIRNESPSTGTVSATAALRLRPWPRAPAAPDSVAVPIASAGWRTRDSSHAALEGISRSPVRVRSDNHRSADVRGITQPPFSRRQRGLCVKTGRDANQCHKASQVCSYPAWGHKARSKSWSMGNLRHSHACGKVGGAHALTTPRSLRPLSAQRSSAPFWPPSPAPRPRVPAPSAPYPATRVRSAPIHRSVSVSAPRRDCAIPIAQRDSQ